MHLLFTDLLALDLWLSLPVPLPGFSTSMSPTSRVTPGWPLYSGWDLYLRFHRPPRKCRQGLVNMPQQRPYTSLVNMA
jgi:hypothetical protein